MVLDENTMKLPITDQFLWDMYGFMEKAGDAVDFMFFTTSVQKGRIMTGGENPIFKKYRKDMGAKRFSNFIYKLKVNNFIKVKSLEGKQGVVLTKEGISKAIKSSFKTDNTNKRKDGKWIMIIFDIPKHNYKSRNLLMSVLKNLGYKILQHSVWVCPFDVSGKTEAALQFYALDRYVKIFLIEEL